MRGFLLILFTLFHWSGYGSALQAQDADNKAERIAQKVLKASGGEERWKKSRYFHWNFFGSRDLWWDKQKHRVRIEWPDKQLTIIADLNAMRGKAWKDGKRVTDSSKEAELFRTARKIWTNDSYWLFMPFKMLDPGVDLSYLRMDELDSGPAHKIRMTFEDVGFTPENKYHVWVDSETNLVRKWAYFPKKDQKEPSMVTPWSGYSKYNELRLASDRGDHKIRDISVPQEVPEGTFSKLAP